MTKEDKKKVKQERLAQALRDNLRRRKRHPMPHASGKELEKSNNIKQGQETNAPTSPKKTAGKT